MISVRNKHYQSRLTMIRLHMGCGGCIKPTAEGWVNIDVRALRGVSVVTQLWDLNMFEDSSVDEIYSRHAIEHCTLAEARRAFTEWVRVLKPGGVLTVICPDLEYHIKQLNMPGKSKFGAWSNHEHAMAGFYGWQRHEHDTHKWGWTKKTLGRELQVRGLSVEYKELGPHHLCIQSVKGASSGGLSVGHRGVPKHLGGHMGVTHTDKGALAYLKDTLGIRTMVDVGCGPGGMLAVAEALGIEAVGIDGDPSLKFTPGRVVIRHDFTKGDLVIEPTDLAWSVEFLEHVEEQWLPHVFSVFNKCSYVFCTHARPTEKKGKHHHVNCQDSQYWVDMFDNYGFVHIPDMTLEARKASSMSRDFVRNTGKLFKRFC